MFAVLVAAVCGLVGASYKMRYGTYLKPAHFWLVLVSDSGSAKSDLMEEILLPTVYELESAYNEIYDQEYNEYEDKLSDWEKKAEKGEAKAAQRPKEPPCTRLAVNRATMEAMLKILSENPSGVLWAHDEFSAFMQGFNQYKKAGGNDQATALSLFSGKWSSTDTVKDNKKTTYTHGGFVSVFGGTTPDILPELFTKNDLKSGFLQRFMFVCANIERKKPSKNKNGEEDRAMLSRIFGGLMSAKHARCRLVENKIVREGSIEIQIDEQGEELLDAFYEKITEYDYNWSEGAEYARANRWKEQCSRLVLILHLLEWSAAQDMEPGGLDSINIAEAGGAVVSAGTVRRATKLFDALIAHSRYAWGKIKERISGQKFETPIRHKRELTPCSQRSSHSCASGRSRTKDIIFSIIT